MEQIKEFERRMDAALDHIAVHLKSSPQAGEKKDHAFAELDRLKADNATLKSEFAALAELKTAGDNQEVINRLSAEKAALAQRLEACEQARKEQAFEVQQLYEDLAKLLGRTNISESGEA
jgi:flagellar biosynthesis/type III secretory pathway chaperone